MEQPGTWDRDESEPDGGWDDAVWVPFHVAGRLLVKPKHLR
jgi:hypothetical protein